jgi:hypothetical protein
MAITTPTMMGAGSRVFINHLKMNQIADVCLFLAIFIRGLHEVFQRSSGNNDLRILIHSYVDVQYNALLDLAASGASYGVVWHGPYQGATAWGQNAALDVMVAAIGAN